MFRKFYFRNAYTLIQGFRNIHSTSNSEAIESFKLTDIGEGIREVIIKKWFVKNGDQIKQFDEICDVQSDKATVTITSRFDGKIVKLYPEINDIVSIGDSLIDVETNNVSNYTCFNSQEDPLLKQKVLATPSVRRIALENNISLVNVKSTGENRLTKDDILGYLERNEESESDRIIPIVGARLIMKKTMTEALKIPSFSYCDEINLTKLVAIRKFLNSSVDQNNVIKLNYLPFFMKASSVALSHFPELNAHTDSDCSKIIVRSSHNIGFAIDSRYGLFVPNIKNVQNLSILKISKEISRLTELGRLGKLSITDLSGGTFTLSNIGSIGGTYTRPIILKPEVIIGGLGKIRKIPHYDDKMNLTSADILTVSWTADHRVIDGALVARFSNMWSNILENPELFLLHNN